MHTCVCSNFRIQGCLIKFTFNRRCPALGNLSCWFYLHVRPCGFSCWCWLWKKIAFASFLLSQPGSWEPICRLSLCSAHFRALSLRVWCLIKHSFARLFCQPTWLPPDPSEPVLPILSPCPTLAGSSFWCWRWKEINFCKQLPFIARFRRTDLLTSSPFVIILADENACRVWCADKLSFARLSIPTPGPLGFHKTSSHSFRLLNRNSFDSDAEESAFNGFSSSPGSPEPVSELPPEP